MGCFALRPNRHVARTGRGGLRLWHARSPWAGISSWDTEQADLVELLTPGTEVNAAWMAELDHIAAAITELRDAGVAVLWRPFHEMTGSGTHPGDPGPTSICGSICTIISPSKRGWTTCCGSIPPPAPGRVYTTDTGKLTLDISDEASATFTADAERTQIVMGYLSQHEQVALSALEVDSRIDGLFWLTSMDDTPLAESRSALFLAVGKQEYFESEITLSEAEGVQSAILTDPGKTPNLLQYMDATITIHSPSLAGASVYALGPAGERMMEIPATRAAESITFNIVDIPSPWFEIVVEE